MIRAIVFDCFGVLATEAWLPFKAKHFGHDPELYERASQIRQKADGGQMSYRASVEAIAHLAGISTSEAAKATEHNVPNEAMFEFIREIRPNYKLGFLSNVAGNYIAHIFTKEQLDLFDYVALSYQNGFVKPDRRAFENVVTKLGVKLEECLLVDDQERNVIGAHEAGMKGVLYTDLNQLKSDLRKLQG